MQSPTRRTARFLHSGIVHLPLMFDTGFPAVGAAAEVLLDVDVVVVVVGEPAFIPPHILKEMSRSSWL